MSTHEREQTLQEVIRWHEAQIANLRQRAEQHYIADLPEAGFSCERDIGVHMFCLDHWRESTPSPEISNERMAED